MRLVVCKSSDSDTLRLSSIVWIETSTHEELAIEIGLEQNNFCHLRHERIFFEGLGAKFARF